MVDVRNKAFYYRINDCHSELVSESDRSGGAIVKVAFSRLTGSVENRTFCTKSKISAKAVKQVQGDRIRIVLLKFICRCGRNQLCVLLAKNNLSIVFCRWTRNEAELFRHKGTGKDALFADVAKW